MRKTIICREPLQAHKAINAVLWPLVKGHLICGGGALVVTVKPETRSDAENRLLHVLLSHISKTQEWAGKKHDVETWKRLMVAAWYRAIGEQVELLPAIDGHGIDIVFRRTSQLTRGECAELIEFIFAWGTHQGIVFPDHEVIDADTGEVLRLAG